MENLIYFSYTNPLHPTAFSSLKEVHQFFKTDASLDLVKEVISQNPVYSKKRRTKKTKFFIPTYVYFKRDLIELDLIDIPFLRGSNYGVKYLLTIIDVATKFAWVIPCRNKSGKLISAKLDAFFSRPEVGQVKRAHFDRGREFTAAVTQDIFKKYRVRCSHPAPGKHAHTVERFNQSFQNILYKYLASKKDNRYVKHLNQLVSIYNDRRHSSTKLSPTDGEKEQNRLLLARNLFYKYGKNAMKYRDKNKKSAIYIGDKVRIPLEKRTFTRSYNNHFSEELYQVHSIDLSKRIPLYVLKIINNNEIDGTEEEEEELLERKFYEEELLKVGRLDGVSLTKVPPFNILKERLNSNGDAEVFVSWISEDIPEKKYDMWVSKKLILDKDVLSSI